MADNGANDTILATIQNGFAKIDARMKALEDRLGDLEANMNDAMISATQQLESRELLATILGVDAGWLPVMRGWAASPDFLLILARLVRELQPRSVVECGSGTTSIVLSKLLADIPGANLLSFDHDADYARKTANMLVERGLPGPVKLSIQSAPLKPHVIKGDNYQWYSLDKVNLPETIDLLVVDGPVVTADNPWGRYPAVPLLMDRLSENAVILVDDTDRITDQETVKRWLKEYPDWHLQLEPTEKGAAILRRRKAA